jgi:hypothetical protein
MGFYAMLWSMAYQEVDSNMIRSIATILRIDVQSIYSCKSDLSPLLCLGVCCSLPVLMSDLALSKALWQPSDGKAGGRRQRQPSW